MLNIYTGNLFTFALIMIAVITCKKKDNRKPQNETASVFIILIFTCVRNQKMNLF